MLDYVNQCLNPHVPRPSCSTTYPYDLWGGYLEPVVRYFKELPSQTTPTFSELRARVGGTASQPLAAGGGGRDPEPPRLKQRVGNE